MKRLAITEQVGLPLELKSQEEWDALRQDANDEAGALFDQLAFGGMNGDKRNHVDLGTRGIFYVDAQVAHYLYDLYNLLSSILSRVDVGKTLSSNPEHMGVPEPKALPKIKRRRVDL